MQNLKRRSQVSATAQNPITLDVYKRQGDEISRIDWVQELVTLFDLTVDEDNYPDNYYSDISTDDSFYRDVMAVSYTHLDVYKRQILFYTGRYRI